jgi:hypothetical protein
LAAEFMREEIPSVRWVVHRILPEGVALLHGKPKLGAKFAPFYADLRAAALLMSVGDLIDLIGWERLGKRGAEAAPKQEDALDPWLGGRTDGDDQASHGNARGGR